MDERTTECLRLSQQVSTLQGEVTRVTKELHSKIWQSYSNKRSLVLGDNVLRDIDADKLINTDVTAMPEATVKDILNHLTDDSKTDEQYRSIFLCIGGNDCIKNIDIDETRRHYNSLLTEAVKKVHKPDQVVVASVMPRLNDLNTQNKIDCLNAVVSDLASNIGAKYVSNEESFLLRNGQVNDGYLQKDGVNLSRLGTQRLVKNLGLRPKTDYSDVCRDAQRTGKKRYPVNKTKQSQNSHPKSPNGNDNADVLHDQTQDGPVYQQRKGASGRSWNPRPGSKRKSGNTSHITTPHNNWDRSFTNIRGREPRDGCDFCGEPNHASVTCRHGKPVECYSCKGMSHKAKSCKRNSY